MKTLTQIIKERIDLIPIEIENLKYENISIIKYDRMIEFLDKNNSILIRFDDSDGKWETISVNTYLSKYLSVYLKPFGNNRYKNYIPNSIANQINLKYLNVLSKNILELLNIKIKTKKLGKTILVDRISLI